MVPNNLTIAVFRGNDFSGYSEAYAEGAVYSSKIRVTEDLLNTKGFAEAILHSITATEKAINNGQSNVEVVLIDADNPNGVWAHLHDYLRLEKEYKPDVALDITCGHRESTAPPPTTAPLPHPFCDPQFKRAWIDQPSTGQALHPHHGQNVLVIDTGEPTLAVYFTEGPVVSAIFPRKALSIGNFAPPKSDTLVTGASHVMKKFQGNEVIFIAIDKNAQSVEAKGNARELLDQLGENYGPKQLREDVEIYELGRKCQLKLFLTPEKD